MSVVVLHWSMHFDGGSDAPRNAHRVPPSMAYAARCMLDACSMRFPAGPTMLRVCRRAQNTVEHSGNTWTLRLADGARRLPCPRITVLWPIGHHSSCHSWTEAPETDSTVTLPERLREGMRTTVAPRGTSRRAWKNTTRSRRCKSASVPIKLIPHVGPHRPLLPL